MISGSTKALSAPAVAAIAPLRTGRFRRQKTNTSREFPGKAVNPVSL
jgi:hypothetical protein